MVALKRSEVRAIEEAMAFPRGFGYVLDFSDRTMEEFFEDEFKIEIYSAQNRTNGSSKRSCLTTLLLNVDSNTALRVLRALWERREGLLESAQSSASTSAAKEKSGAFQAV